MVYHTGHLSPPEKECVSALKASAEGLVFLCQRRRSVGGFDYEAHRISRRCAKLLGLVTEDKRKQNPVTGAAHSLHDLASQRTSWRYNAL